MEGDNNKLNQGEGEDTNNGDAAQGAAGTEPAKEPTPKEPEGDDVKDKHGQPGINLERHNKEMAAKDEEIANLKEELAEKAKTEQGREELNEKIANLEKEIADERVNHKLEMAKCRNLKAARALLDDYDGDVKKLKEAEPWLFEEEKPSGTTGVKPNASKATAEEERINKALGLKTKKE